MNVTWLNLTDGLVFEWEWIPAAGSSIWVRKMWKGRWGQKHRSGGVNTFSMYFIIRGQAAESAAWQQQDVCHAACVCVFLNPKPRNCPDLQTKQNWKCHFCVQLPAVSLHLKHCSTMMWAVWGWESTGKYSGGGITEVCSTSKHQIQHKVKLRSGIKVCSTSMAVTNL